MAEFREQTRRQNEEILQLLRERKRMGYAPTISDNVEDDMSDFESFVSAFSKPASRPPIQERQGRPATVAMAEERIAPVNPHGSSVVLVDRGEQESSGTCRSTEMSTSGGRQDLKQKLHAMKESLEKRVRDTPRGMWRRGSNPFTFQDDKVLRNWKVVDKK